MSNERTLRVETWVGGCYFYRITPLGPGITLEAGLNYSGVRSQLGADVYVWDGHRVVKRYDPKAISAAMVGWE